MIVRVDGAVFDRSVEDSFELLDVIHLCARGIHSFVAEDGAAKAIDRWCDAFGGAMAQALRDELRLARKRGASAGARGRTRAEIRVLSVATDDWSADPPRLGLRTAWHFLHRPLRLIVENARSDGAFVRAMLHGDDGEFLRKAIAEGRLVCAQGGGIGEVRKLVEAMADDPAERFRAVVMFDHDGFSPAEPARPVRELRALCDEAGVACHPLQRRSIENYIPIKALRRWIDRQRFDRQDALSQRVNALETLGRKRPEVRNHYNMKDGLCGDMGDALPAPFLTIDDALFEPLARGFGDKIALQVFAEAEHPIHESWLRADGSADELQRLAALLIERL